MLEECSVFNKGLCLGCTGLAEWQWIGPEQCDIYRRHKNTSNFEICKKIILKGYAGNR